MPYSYVSTCPVPKSTNVWNCVTFLPFFLLSKICNHPKLALEAGSDKRRDVEQRLQAGNSSLDDIKQSSKLLALKQLLEDCGIGASSESEYAGGSGSSTLQAQIPSAGIRHTGSNLFGCDARDVCV